MAHLNYNLDYCVETFLVFENKVLLRIHDKYKLWFSVGGHIEPNEDLETAARREILEEVGLSDVEFYRDEDSAKYQADNFQLMIQPRFIYRHKITEDHDHLVMVFFAQAKTDKLELSTTEITEHCKWFTKSELQEKKYHISEDVKFRALEALKLLAS
jgi:8-oxo-dGTP pyrophosphatase MutT (NUDIX family)